jgi:uncharacterized RDD family membrane protein YckC
MEQAVQPASFLRRLTALVIDILILALVDALLLEPILGFLGLRQFKDPSLVKLPFAVAVMISYVGTAILFLVLAWLYFAIQESSAKGGTFGKRFVGITVSGLDGNSLSFGQATSRFFGKFVSSILLFGGFGLVLFRSDRRALHDIMAGTKVLQLMPASKVASPITSPKLRSDPAVSMN